MDKTVPAFAGRLLDFIGGIEAPAGYDTIYANAQKRVAAFKARPITKRTIAEWISDGKRGQASSAAGRYQFMQATLKSLMTELGLRGSEVMTPDMQDRLGFHLLKRRGYDKYVAGSMSLQSFALNLSKEWASLPVLSAVTGAHRLLKRGQSYYAGDSLNKSLVTPERVEAILRTVKDAAPRVVVAAIAPPPDVETAPATKRGFFARLFGRAA